MELKTLKAETRDGRGKNPARRERAAGKVPAILYGGDGQEPVSVSFDAKEFDALVADSGTHALVQLEVRDNPALNTAGMVKEVQFHPVRGSVLHADVMRIRLDERLQTSVPITLVGHTKGVVDGGILEHFLREIEIECLALDVPDEITIDTTDWEIGFSYHVADMTPPSDVTIITEEDRTVAAIHAPRVLDLGESAEEGEEEAAAEGEEGEAEESEESES